MAALMGGLLAKPGAASAVASSGMAGIGTSALARKPEQQVVGMRKAAAPGSKNMNKSAGLAAQNLLG